MTLRALAAGFLLPAPPWKGRLLGAFRGAVSLLHPDGLVLSLVSREEDMECFALRLGGADFAALSAAAERALAEAEDDRPVVAEARTAAGGRGLWSVAGLELEPGSAVWDPRPALAAAAAAIAALDRGGLAARRARLAACFERGRPTLGIHPGGAFEARFRELLSGGGALGGLAGFGPGSTPAGDDFIAGYLLARSCLGEPAADELGADPSRTTPAGRTLLLQALAGGFPASYLRLAEAFAADEGRVEAAAAELLGHGASSGADAIAGFLHGWGPQAA